ncbi:hypothetical protein N7492_002670 [Penicillium capsulatum]|uniref:Trichothecene 3-O-acetyltransferase-like N-terminal domain-containing protein n=1 Tax=Penicillium capsulatum TaxID=69766 RepID=A0A9W9IM16_9EURO|nr:hypothetical protein N7492_002670 [Penicillium capsulatum]KAJ6122731.1 hypothetical protein N7512_005196 [Penicillium capsulatum]
MEALPGTRDIWGRLPRMKGYTHLALCLAQGNTSQNEIQRRLEIATQRIGAALPRGWAGCSGIFTVARNVASGSILRDQDRRDVCPSFGEMVEGGGTGAQLDGSVLSAETSLPDSYIESEEDPAPVLTVTVNWIRDGLVLDCAAQHNILDMGGIDQFLRLLAAAMSGREFEKEAIEVNSRDRLGLFPRLHDGEQRLNHSFMRCASSLTPALRKRASGPQPEFHHFRFSAGNLTRLAVAANPPSVDDALSAFVWKRLSMVRLEQGQSFDTMTGFSRAVDCRRTLDISAEYMGVAVLETDSKVSFQEMTQSSLTELAACLRQDVHRIRNQYFLRSLATTIAEEPDKSTYNFVPDIHPNTWVNASSWAGVPA